MPLSLRIVPNSFSDSGPRGIILTGASQHFHAVLTNTGKSTIRLWQDSCSWGYSNLSFEAEDQDGKKIAIIRKQRGWEKNFPDWIAIPPGDYLVLDIKFDDNTWQNPPLLDPGQQKLMNLRAIYESTPTKEARANKIWSGKVVSPKNAYALFR
jgi:hypothetical protein